MFYVHWILKSERRLGTAWVSCHKACVQKGEWNTSSQDADLMLAWYAGPYFVVALSPWPGCRLRLHWACSCAVFKPPLLFSLVLWHSQHPEWLVVAECGGFPYSSFACLFSVCVWNLDCCTLCKRQDPAFLWPFCNVCHLNASQVLTTSFSPPQYEHGWFFLLFYRDLKDREILIICPFIWTGQLKC